MVFLLLFMCALGVYSERHLKQTAVHADVEATPTAVAAAPAPVATAPARILPNPWYVL